MTNDAVLQLLLHRAMTEFYKCRNSAIVRECSAEDLAIYESGIGSGDKAREIVIDYVCSKNPEGNIEGHDVGYY